MVCFALVDDHVHLVLRLPVGRLARVQGALTRVLNARSAAPFGPAYVRQVASRQHLVTLVGYCLGQFAHHGLADDPAVTTGSFFPNLIGARRVPGLSLLLAAALPRFRAREAYAAVARLHELQPASDAELRALGPIRLVDLVAQTFATGPALRGQRPGKLATRQVAARLAAEVGLRPRDLAEALGVSVSAANRLAAAPLPEADARAERLRVSLAAAAANRGAPGRAAPGRPATSAPTLAPVAPDRRPKVAPMEVAVSPASPAAAAPRRAACRARSTEGRGAPPRARSRRGMSGAGHRR